LSDFLFALVYINEKRHIMKYFPQSSWKVEDVKDLMKSYYHFIIFI